MNLLEPWGLDGAVVRLPSQRCAVACPAPIYVRTGQPPGASQLYRIDPQFPTIEMLDDHERATRIEPGLLPCGIARIDLHREHHRVHAVIEVVVAERWVFVQRAPCKCPDCPSLATELIGECAFCFDAMGHEGHCTTCGRILLFNRPHTCS